MRLRWSVPLPGPFSIGGGIPLGGNRRRQSGRGGNAGCAALLVAPFVLIWWLLVAEVWLVWWSVKVWWLLALFIRHRNSGQPMPKQRGWW